MSYAKFQRDRPSGSAAILEKRMEVYHPPARARVKVIITALEFSYIFNCR